MAKMPSMLENRDSHMIVSNTHSYTRERIENVRSDSRKWIGKETAPFEEIRIKF